MLFEKIEFTILKHYRNDLKTLTISNVQLLPILIISNKTKKNEEKWEKKKNKEVPNPIKT